MGLAATVLLLFLAGPSADDVGTEKVTFSEFLTLLDEGRVRTIVLAADGTADGALDDDTRYETTVPVALAGEELLDRIERAGVAIEAADPAPSSLSNLLGWLFALAPLLLLIGFWIYLGRRAGGQFSNAMGMGRSRAKVFDSDRPATTFADVAGYGGVKEEITEIVDFLRDPARYRAAGAVAPRGVLMTGPPGTGKTLMARAVAGEAGVPFLSVTGSSFVEMFVGVGAARVRDLFAEARKLAPAIIFVDEIDGIGQRRGGPGMLSNDEREQTLNQLLAEMDGFDPTEGIVVLAATNRPDILDPALLRPGRFDRQVMIPLPTQEDRTAILQVHCRGKQLADDVDLEVLARGTPGFSGADLANLVNEAAIRAARERRTVLDADDFDAARDRILLGHREGSNVLLPEERRAVAVHEAGHAIVAAVSEAADPVHKVTILPAGRALGATHQLPLHERHLYSERHLYDTLAVQLGGRAAELVVFGQGSTGAANDLAEATHLATKMVRELGMSAAIGPVGYPSGGPMFLPGGAQVSARPFAEDTQRAMDLEVERLLTDAQDRALAALGRERGALDRLVELLLDRETVEGAEVYRVLGRLQPSRSPQVLGDAAPTTGGETPAAELAGGAVHRAVGPTAAQP
ncbi:MAG: ATP-dependent zinc metalloprotease FtsH, partial [Acidimicrobiales bacterium]|nr:ATP-dependent zinc metalloprotease FtsH [Acidimicrobiales bacterium]